MRSPTAAKAVGRATYLMTPSPQMGFTGSPAACSSGTTDPAYRTAELTRINALRAIARCSPTVTENANWSADAQSAAMMVAANNAITHTPPSSCACYSATNAATAGRSNLGRGIAGPEAVSGYVSDPGQVTNEVGHSAGLFWPSLTTVGVGDALSAGNRPYNVMKYLSAPNTTNPRAPVRDASGYVSWPTCDTAFPYELLSEGSRGRSASRGSTGVRQRCRSPRTAWRSARPGDRTVTPA